MALASAAEFSDLVLTRPLEDVVKTHLFDGEVHAFLKAPVALKVLQERLARSLNIPPHDIRVVGSAKTGFSLDPNAFPRQFSASSDIDVAVVSATLFDGAWHTVLAWDYLRRHRLPQRERKWAIGMREDFYWGYLVPTQLRFSGLLYPSVLTPLRDLSTMWFNAFRGLGAEPSFADRDVNGRLYRSWDHALRYHVHGLERIRKELERRKR
jgi:hypothetical protein